MVDDIQLPMVDECSMDLHSGSGYWGGRARGQIYVWEGTYARLFNRVEGGSGERRGGASASGKKRGTRYEMKHVGEGETGADRRRGRIRPCYS